MATVQVVTEPAAPGGNGKRPPGDPDVRDLIVLPGREFEAMFSAAHEQGEHCSFSGPTGSGKSVAELWLAEIVGRRRTKPKSGPSRPTSVVVLGTKPRDDTLSAFIKNTDFKQIKKWPPAYGEEHAVVWVRGGSPEQEVKKQSAVYRPLLNQIYQEGGQYVVIDEAAYFEAPAPDGLGLRGIMSKFWADARSNKVTLIAGTQRPRNVTRLMWSEPSWTFIFKPKDLDDMKRVAEISGRKPAVLTIVPRLGGHEFLCIRSQKDGREGLYVSKVGT